MLLCFKVALCNTNKQVLLEHNEREEPCQSLLPRIEQKDRKLTADHDHHNHLNKATNEVGKIELQSPFLLARICVPLPPLKTQDFALYCCFGAKIKHKNLKLSVGKN